MEELEIFPQKGLSLFFRGGSGIDMIALIHGSSSGLNSRLPLFNEILFLMILVVLFKGSLYYSLGFYSWQCYYNLFFAIHQHCGFRLKLREIN